MSNYTSMANRDLSQYTVKVVLGEDWFQTGTLAGVNDWLAKLEFDDWTVPNFNMMEPAIILFKHEKDAMAFKLWYQHGGN